MSLSPYLPTEQEKKKVHEIRDALLESTTKMLSENKIQAKIMAVGSTAKDTFVRGDTDIDIFIVSPQFKEAYHTFQQQIPQGRRKEGPMNIWHFIKDGYDVDLVCVPPDHPRIQTLIHTEFMNRNLSPKQKQEAIRAKAFFKSQGVYGAEIGGIVGIAVEEMIRRYDTLEKACQVLASSEQVPFLEDPANPKRTLLASIKPVRWQQIHEVCWKIIEHKRFPFRPFTAKDYLLQKGKGWEHLNFARRTDRAIDFHTGLSACNHALHEVRNREKEVKGNCDAFVFDHVVVSFSVSPTILPKTKVYCGPPITMSESVEAFRVVHPDAFEKNGSICAVIEREKTDVIEWMRELIAERMETKGYDTI